MNIIKAIANVLLLCVYFVILNFLGGLLSGFVLGLMNVPLQGASSFVFIATVFAIIGVVIFISVPKIRKKIFFKFA